MPTADWAVIFFKYFRKGNRPFNHKVNKNPYTTSALAQISVLSANILQKTANLAYAYDYRHNYPASIDRMRQPWLRAICRQADCHITIRYEILPGTLLPVDTLHYHYGMEF